MSPFFVDLPERVPDLREALLTPVDLDHAIGVIQDARTRIKIALSGLSEDAAFAAALARADRKMWPDYADPQVDPALRRGLADKLYNARKGFPEEHVIVHLGDPAREIGVFLVRRLYEEGVSFDLEFYDPNLDALIVNHAGEAGVCTVAEDLVRRYAPATRRIVCRGNRFEGSLLETDSYKRAIFDSILSKAIERVSSGEIFFTLTTIPTRRDAEIDLIPYEAYLPLYFEMIDQPWDLISDAQKYLIALLDRASHLRFVNDWGTDVGMDIDGFTFCNSMNAKNVPGSEVFSAPRRDSVNGRIVSKGRFVPPGSAGGVTEDLMMTFEDGYLKDFSARSGATYFEAFLNRDPGNRYTGEIGIGTNPHLKHHLTNTLLVEKIGGSFHLALGRAYSLTEYEGVAVNVDNGNRSIDHWDLTTMLYGCGGKIYVDGAEIMRDGRFLASELEVLNRGWASVPPEKRPSYWQHYPFSED